MLLRKLVFLHKTFADESVNCEKLRAWWHRNQRLEVLISTVWCNYRLNCWLCLVSWRLKAMTSSNPADSQPLLLLHLDKLSVRYWLTKQLVFVPQWLLEGPSHTSILTATTARFLPLLWLLQSLQTNILLRCRCNRLVHSLLQWKSRRRCRTSLIIVWLGEIDVSYFIFSAGM